MEKNKYTVFISDTHFNDIQPLMVQLFINFLRQNKERIEALYLLGDLFEAWVGDDNITQLSQQISNILAECTNSGVNVYFVRGNRDFLLGEKFAQNCGLNLLNDKTLISLYGKPTLLMHGDLLCTHDRSYQRYRSIMFSPWLKKICLLLPLALRKKIAEKLRQVSSTTLSTKSYQSMDVAEETVIKELEANHVQLLIHGHTHRPGCHDVKLTHETAQRMVLGAWENGQGNAIIASKITPARFITFEKAQIII